MTKAQLNTLLEQDAKLWEHPNDVDRAYSCRINSRNIVLFMKLIERKERDFHASLWSKGFYDDIDKLGSTLT